MKLYIDHQEPEESEPRVAVSLRQTAVSGCVDLVIGGVPVIRVTGSPKVVKFRRYPHQEGRGTLEQLGFEFDDRDEIKTY